MLVATADAAKAPRYKGRVCRPPSGYKVADCRLGKHGTPDLSRKAWRALFGKEVTISVRIRSLAPNGTARDWPLLDSLGAPIGRLRQRESGALELVDADGTPYLATVVNVRGRGCAASTRQMRDFTLVQAIAPKAPGGGVQAFIERAALDDPVAARAFESQRGTGCGPSGKEVGKVRPLSDPRVGKLAHARLGNGELNSVSEYDAKPAFGNVVYFSSNTTSVHVGGIARGMVLVGTPVAKVDTMPVCDPNSDGTLTWRYWAIRTGRPSHPRMYGWIPARCGAS